MCSSSYPWVARSTACLELRLCPGKSCRRPIVASSSSRRSARIFGGSAIAWVSREVSWRLGAMRCRPFLVFRPRRSLVSLEWRTWRLSLPFRLSALTSRPLSCRWRSLEWFLVALLPTSRLLSRSRRWRGTRGGIRCPAGSERQVRLEFGRVQK